MRTSLVMQSCNGLPTPFPKDKASAITAGNCLSKLFDKTSRSQNTE